MSIRDRILQEVVNRIAALSGWEAQHRNIENETNWPKFAVVWYDTDNRLSANNLHVIRQLSVVVQIAGRAEEAVSDSGNSPFRLLDQMFAEVEGTLLGTPFDIPGVVELLLDGNAPNDPDGSNIVSGTIRLNVTYRHDHDDSGSYSEMG